MVKRDELSAEAMRQAIKREAEADEQADRWDTWASDPDRLREVGYHPGSDVPLEYFKLHVLSRIKTYTENGDEK